MGFSNGVANVSRVLEHTDDAARSYIAPTGTIDPTRLRMLPTLFMPEVGDTGSKQVAQVGHIEDLTLVGKDYHFRFVPSQEIPQIASDRIVGVADKLAVDRWEFNRTHWAVKCVDLYRVINDSLVGVRLTPRIFDFPIGVPRDDSLVAIMMPFGKQYDIVYAALKKSVESVGLNCVRADDFWESDQIMEDVIRLIWSARVVISDFTATNPNVFYETGIAHSLGRDVVQIAQSSDEIPFDLRALRTVTYAPDAEGLVRLKEQVAIRLQKLVAT